MGLFESRNVTLIVVFASLALTAGLRFGTPHFSNAGSHLCAGCFREVRIIGPESGMSIPKLLTGRGAIHQAGQQLSELLLAAINRDRGTAGLAPLRPNVPVGAVAFAHSFDMASSGYLGHDDLHGLSPYDRLRRSGIRYRVAGENIGYDAGGPQDAMIKAIEDAMLHSPEHRANLLRASFTQVGIGIAVKDQKIVVTEDFTAAG